MLKAGGANPLTCKVNNKIFTLQLFYRKIHKFANNLLEMRAI